MYLFYVDESGTPDPVSEPKKIGCSNKFIIGGILINSNDAQYLEESFYNLKEKFLKFPLKEMKYNTKSSNIKIGFNKEKMREATFEFINQIDCNFKIITLVFDKTRINEKKYIENSKVDIYASSLQFLLERVNLELNNTSESCLVVLDSRNKEDNKVLYCSYMNLLKYGTNFQRPEKFKHFLPSIAFSDSEFCMNLCVADFCCASVFQLEEYNRPRYYETIKNKFRNNNGTVKGYGIAYFP